MTHTYRREPKLPHCVFIYFCTYAWLLKLHFWGSMVEGTVKLFLPWFLPCNPFPLRKDSALLHVCAALSSTNDPLFLCCRLSTTRYNRCHIILMFCFWKYIHLPEQNPQKNVSWPRRLVHIKSNLHHKWSELFLVHSLPCPIIYDSSQYSLIWVGLCRSKAISSSKKSKVNCS